MSPSDELRQLRPTDLTDDPMVLFDRWYRRAREVVPEPSDAVVLATATREGRVSARVVLLKAYDERGFVFFTNYESRKGRDIRENPHAALVFYWRELGRQVRAVGRVERTSREESEAYFHSRPRRSQIGAWASRQSEPIPNRQALDAQVEAYTRRFAEDVIPLPPYWGGFRLIPSEIEFWQDRPDRLHDRFRYALDASGEWSIDRLSP